MHVILNITTKQSHYNLYTIIILLFLWAYVIGPMTRHVAHGLGPGLSLKYEIVVQAGPGLDILFAGRDGPGPHNSFCGPGPSWSAELLRVRTGPGHQTIFAGLA